MPREGSAQDAAEEASLRERRALQALKDVIVAAGLPAGRDVAVLAAAGAYAKAQAHRIVAERMVMP